MILAYFFHQSNFLVVKMSLTRADALEIIRNLGATVTMADLKPHKITIAMVRSLVKSQELENPAWGVYRLPGVEQSLHSDWAVLAKKYPESVICLLSAATFHNMTQEIFGKLSVALPHDKGLKKPSMGNYFSLSIDTLIWRNSQMFDLGVDTHLIDGTPVKITSPERTLVDLFRYSAFSSMKTTAVRITDEMFLECLNRCNSEHMGHFSFDTVAAIAREFKCYEAMRPYTKTLRYVRSEVPSL